MNPRNPTLADLTCRFVQRKAEASDRPALIFVSGAQGLGKSTAMKAVSAMPGCRVACLSLDDFYLTAAERAALATRIHALCATRGPPGTHDIALLAETLERLRRADDATETTSPLFDKPRDDRARDSTRRWHGRYDAIVVEGWLMGARPDPASPMDAPMNALEEEDAHGHWRAWQEEALATSYASLWEKADAFLHLDAPGFDAVMHWRCQQEESNMGLTPGTLPADRKAWVGRFIQHYERLTRRMLGGGRRGGAQICVDAERQVISHCGISAD